MLKRLTDLLWLRKQIMGSNKSIVFSMLIPFFFLYFYKFINSTDGKISSGASLGLTVFCLSFFFNVSIGILISSILTDEKEKGNLRTLLLTGVRPVEYIISTLIFPFLQALVLIVATPFVLELSVTKNLLPYAIITTLTALMIILIYLLLGMFCKNQVSLQIYSFPVMLGSMMLPNLPMLFPQAQVITDLSFMGLYTKLFLDWKNFNWGNSSLQVLSFLVWAVLIAYFSFRRVKQLKSLV